MAFHSVLTCLYPSAAVAQASSATRQDDGSPLIASSIARFAPPSTAESITIIESYIDERHSTYSVTVNGVGGALSPHEVPNIVRLMKTIAKSPLIILMNPPSSLPPYCLLGYSTTKYIIAQETLNRFLAHQTQTCYTFITHLVTNIRMFTTKDRNASFWG